MGIGIRSLIWYSSVYLPTGELPCLKDCLNEHLLTQIAAASLLNRTGNKREANVCSPIMTLSPKSTTYPLDAGNTTPRADNSTEPQDTVEPTNEQLCRMSAPDHIRAKCRTLLRWKLQYPAEYHAWFELEKLKDTPSWMEAASSNTPGETSNAPTQFISHANRSNNSITSAFTIGRQSCPNNASQRHEPQGSVSAHHFRSRHRKR
jgi:hypothetical protein